MQHARRRLIHLYETNELTRNMIKKLLQRDHTLKEAFTYSPTHLQNLLTISSNRAQAIYNKMHTVQTPHHKQNEPTHMQRITIFDAIYPTQLKQINDPPLVLYAIGKLSLLETYPLFSVIGTRRPSREANEKVKKIVSPLIQNKWTIVSGFAYGIDQMAHEQTIRLNGYTIAILGSGFNHVYPRNNSALFHAICKRGLVMTEYPPFVRPQRHHFPERNRIISGLSKGVLVMEAKQRSGTLITVDQALDQGREVYAVPGNPFVKQTTGCHQLIQDGAKLVIDANDILEDWK